MAQGRGSWDSPAGQEVMGCDHPWVRQCFAENPRALLWLKPIHGESTPQTCRRASQESRAFRSHPYTTREHSKLPCQQGHGRRALWHPHPNPRILYSCSGTQFCVCTAVFLISGAQGFLSLLPKQEQPATSSVCGTEARQQWLAVCQTQSFGPTTPRPSSPGHRTGNRMGELASILGHRQNLVCVT